MSPLLVAVALWSSAHAADPAPSSEVVQGEPAAVIAYRHQAFQGMGKHLKAVSMAAKGRVTLPQKDLLMHTKALARAARQLPGWFPAGTGAGKETKSEALSEIWTNASGFQEAAGAFQTATKALVEVAESNDTEALLPAVKKVGASCGGCHDAFRKDDER